MTDSEDGEILRALGRVEEEIASIKETAAASLVESKKTNGRITDLERWRLRLEEHQRTLAAVEAQREDDADDALAERDRTLTRRDNLRNLILGALFALATAVFAALLADQHPFK